MNLKIKVILHLLYLDLISLILGSYVVGNLSPNPIAWTLISFIPIFYYFRYLYKSNQFRLSIYTGSCILGSIIGTFIYSAVWKEFPQNPNYIGISCKELAYDLEGYEYSDEQLFKIDDEVGISGKYDQCKTKDNTVSEIGFLFWQTGVSYGFEPVNIIPYSKPKKILDQFEHFFSIGPVALSENFLRCMNVIFPWVLLTFLFFKIYFWRDFEMSSSIRLPLNK